MTKEDADSERRRLQRTAGVLLACHLLELALTIWLTAELTRQRPQLLALLVVLLVAQLLVAAASLIWVHQQLRFEDRWAGRLLCYLLHALGCALLWRAGKLFLAFDARDVRELATLRHLLVHAQTVPVCLLHMYVSYLSGSLGLFPAAPVVILLGSGVTTVVLASSVFGGGAGGAPNGSALSLPTLPEPADSPLAVPRGAAADWTGTDDAWSRLLVAVQALCLLWARLTALATFGSLWLSWAAGTVAVHWAVAAVWLAAQQYLLEEQRSVASRAGRVAFLAYLLVFDWQVNRDSGSAVTVCARPRAAACYYLLIGLENSVLLGLWVAFSDHIPHTKLATVTGAAATFSVGAVILVMLYCYSAEAALTERSDEMLEVRATAGSGKIIDGSTVVLHGQNHTYVDYKIDDEVLSDRRRRGTGVSAVGGGGNLYTAFPMLTRSDRSADNHSANSRNTNTLCDPEPVCGEPLVLMPCSGASDSTISSLSRPVCYTSTPRRAPWEKTTSRRRSAPVHVCTAGAGCHCRLFDHQPQLHLLEPRHPAGCHAATAGRPFRVLCAGCLVAHDPLLTACERTASSARRQRGVGAENPPTAHVHKLPPLRGLPKSAASTTDYPSDSAGSDRGSVSSESDHSAISEEGGSTCSSYTTWPPRSNAGTSIAPLSWLLPPDLSGREYVQAWLELCGQKSDFSVPRRGRRKKKLCQRQHAGCPHKHAPLHVRAAPPTPPTPARRTVSRKQQLKKALLHGKLLKRSGKQRARSASPRPGGGCRAMAIAAPPVAGKENTAHAAAHVVNVRNPALTFSPLGTPAAPSFVQNVEAYV